MLARIAAIVAIIWKPGLSVRKTYNHGEVNEEGEWNLVMLIIKIMACIYLSADLYISAAFA